MAFSFTVDECNLNSMRLICDKCGYKSFAFPKGCKKSIRDVKKDLDVHICKPVEITPKPTDESLNHQDYYGGDSPYEALKIIFHYNLGFCLGNVLKYIIRAGKKDPTKEIEDLKKALIYLQREIENLLAQKNTLWLKIISAVFAKTRIKSSKDAEIYSVDKIVVHYKLYTYSGNVLKCLIDSINESPDKKISNLKRARSYLRLEIEHLQSQGGGSC